METLSAILWMGEITPIMDEAFIIEAFANMGYTALGVKEMRNKHTGERANYCFVDFGDINVAREVLIKVNNEPIPGTDNKKFKLNRSEYGRSTANSETEYSMFVGDLSPDVTNDLLLDFFRVKYSSVRAAKVVTDELGNPKGFGFVRFFNEEEHKKALVEMQGAKGLGQRQIRVNKAAKSKNQTTNNSMQQRQDFGMADPSNMPQWMQMQMQYMQQMHQYMQQCHQYAQQAAAYAGLQQRENPSIMDSQPNKTNRTDTSSESSFMESMEQQHAQMVSQVTELDEDLELVDPDSTVDIAALNQEIIDRDDNLFFELEASRWDFDLAVLQSAEPRSVKVR